MERQPLTLKQIFGRLGLLATAGALSACGGKFEIGNTVHVKGKLQEGLTGRTTISTICEPEQGELFEIDGFGTISHGSAGTETIARVSSQAKENTTDCAGQSGQVHINQIKPAE